MADKKLNEVTKVTDMAYVPVIMADGSIGQIAKADLASVVAGFIPSFLQKGFLSNNVDLNNLFDFGIYSFASGGPSNSASNNASILLVYGYNAERVLQVQISMNGDIYSRFFSGSSWSSWRSNGSTII